MISNFLMHNILGEGKTVLNVFYWSYEMSGWLSFVFAGPTLLLSKTLLRRSKNNNISGKKTFFYGKRKLIFLTKKNVMGPQIIQLLLALAVL